MSASQCACFRYPRSIPQHRPLQQGLHTANGTRERYQPSLHRRLSGIGAPPRPRAKDVRNRHFSAFAIHGIEREWAVCTIKVFRTDDGDCNLKNYYSSSTSTSSTR